MSDDDPVTQKIVVQCPACKGERRLPYVSPLGTECMKTCELCRGEGDVHPAVRFHWIDTHKNPV